MNFDPNLHSPRATPPSLFCCALQAVMERRLSTTPCDGAVRKAYAPVRDLVRATYYRPRYDVDKTALKLTPVKDQIWETCDKPRCDVNQTALKQKFSCAPPTAHHGQGDQVTVLRAPKACARTFIKSRPIPYKSPVPSPTLFSRARTLITQHLRNIASRLTGSRPCSLEQDIIDNIRLNKHLGHRPHTYQKTYIKFR